MSEANVEIVRRAWEAHTRHDNESALRLYDPEVEIYDGLGVVYRGVDGVREFFSEYFGVMVDRGGEVEEWIDAGDEVIAVMHSWGRGKRGGVPVESHAFHVWAVRDGKLARLRILHDRAEALEAVGLAGSAASEDNVEITKGVVDAFNRRDITAFAELTTPDFEWVPVTFAIEGETFRGREGIETYLGRLDEAWEDYRVVAGEYRDLGDRVLYLGHMVGRGRGSGVPVDTPLGALTDYRAGKCWRLRNFRDHGAALRAAGLSE